MDQSLDVGHVAETLPDLDSALADPRLRPVGVAGGAALIVVGALLQVGAAGEFWAQVVAGVLAFVGVPLFCLGLVAPEPERDDAPFSLGIEFSPGQRRIVGAGAGLLLSAPVLAVLLGPAVGTELVVWLTGATVALVGAVLVLTGFVAWTSRAINGNAPMQ